MKKKYVIGGVIVLAAVIYLVIVILQNMGSYYQGVSEFYEDIEKIGDNNVRVAGTVVNGSVAWDAEKVKLSFIITEGDQNLPVLYNGAQPSNFKEGSAILVEGKYGSDGMFHASQLILRCSSKYEALLE
ncbi:MAG TPA: cytochrome c maturation protein CcmE [Dehalococcoidia bacterium]|nr:cytochrome c maturation protein CcmE [Dehalococcoidia bacterium]